LGGVGIRVGSAVTISIGAGLTGGEGGRRKAKRVIPMNSGMRISEVIMSRRFLVRNDLFGDGVVVWGSITVRITHLGKKKKAVA
jgi:hypothetical protein